MSDLRVRVDVSCPDHEATRHFTDFIGEHQVAAGEVSVTLRLPGKIFATRRTPLERRVDATLVALRSTSDSYQTYSVYLAHRTGSPSPFFSGTLAIHPSAPNDSLGLAIVGHYEAHVETISPLWERASGHRIALAANSDLLRTIGAYIELASARNKASRAGVRYHRPQRVESGIGGAPIVV